MLQGDVTQHARIGQFVPPNVWRSRSTAWFTGFGGRTGGLCALLGGIHPVFPIGCPDDPSAPESKEGLIRLLNAPVPTRRSSSCSAVGAGPFDALGELIRVEDGVALVVGPITLEQPLERQETASTLMLEAYQPSSCVSIWMRWWVPPTAGG